MAKSGSIPKDEENAVGRGRRARTPVAEPAQVDRSAGGGSEESLVARAIHAVTDYIRTEGLRVGDTLPGEMYFAERLEVSRTVMREAYRALAALQLIVVANGRRPRVSAVSGDVIATSLAHAVTTAQISIPEIWDVRRTIEVRTAALAATLRTEDEAQELLELSEKIAACYESPETVVPYDVAFHQAIARASRNTLFAHLVSSFEPMMHIATPVFWKTRTTQAQRRETVRRHRAIAKAIARRDAQAAAAAMEAHFDASIGEILQRFRGVDVLPLRGGPGRAQSRGR